MTLVPAVKQDFPAGIYANLETRRILEYLLRNTQTIIEPSFLPNDELVYQQVEAILGHAPEDALGLLEELHSAGALTRTLVDKTPSCPECASKQLSTRYTCPKCSTYDINRTYLFEHLKCGKVGNEVNFKKNDQLICPECQTVLHDFGVEYRAVGVWFECNKCQNSFDIPRHIHFCRTNHHQFSPDRVNLIPIYRYELNRKTMEQSRRQVLVYADAITFLENLRLTVTAPDSLLGKSGQPQAFDIVVSLPKKGWRRKEGTMAIDVIVGDGVAPAENVRTFAAKVREARPSDSCLIVVPGLDEDAQALAVNLSVNFVEGTTLPKAMQSFQSKYLLKEHVQ